MKLTNLCTTSKVYLLTLLLITIILFLNQSVFAQSESKTSVSLERLAVMERYLGWIEADQYGQYQEDLGKKTLNEFKSFLTKVLAEDKDCLTQKSNPEPTFVQNLQSFFFAIISQISNTSSDQSAQLSSCKAKIKDDYKLTKKYNRLLKYLQVEEGKPNVCIKADLGVGTALKARGFNPTKVASDNPKETGRTGKLPVYLCTGQDGKKKVRVVDDSGTRLRLSPEDAAKTEFKVENLPPRNSFNKLLEKLGL